MDFTHDSAVLNCTEQVVQEKSPAIYVVHADGRLAEAVQVLALSIPVAYVQATRDGLVNKADEDKLRHAEVVLGSFLFLDRNPHLFPKLKWFQGTAAGVNILFTAIAEGRILPNFRCSKNGTVSCHQMTEYVIGHLIAHERRFEGLWELQREQKWAERDFVSHRPLYSLTIGILGLGPIGDEIARTSKHFGMTVWGLKQTAPKERKEYIDRYCLRDDLPELLRSSDYIVSVLPSTPGTKGFLSGEVLSDGKEKKPVLISIGRGDVIDEASLLNALREGWISAAILDVLPKEPLPAESPLWLEPNVTITPHCASRPTYSTFPRIAAFFMKNYQKFLGNEPMEGEVDWDRGY